MKSFNSCCLVAILWLVSLLARADGSNIDKVYHPYVQLLEKEIEYRVLYENDSSQNIDGRHRHKLGYGQSLSDQFFIEVYVTGAEARDNNFEVESYEVEFKWQLTEQGEYENDWGLLFEVEKEKSYDLWELSTTLIALHEWHDWVATGNLSLVYEWGNDIDNEWETAFAGQLRYRYSALLEPAIELYQSQDSSGIGPIITGLWRFGVGNKINWEFGPIFGLKSDTADVSWKFNLEFEFR